MSSSATPAAKSVTDSWIFTHRSLIGIACLAPAGLAVIFSKPWIAESSPWALLLDFAGWILFLAYLSMRIWATLYVGGVKDKILQTTGPYSITRNPLYVGGFCFALSITCFLKSFSLAALTLAASAAYVRWVIPAEEEVLESIFGDAFREYKRHVPAHDSPALALRCGIDGGSADQGDAHRSQALVYGFHDADSGLRLAIFPRHALVAALVHATLEQLTQVPPETLVIPTAAKPAEGSAFPP